MGISGGFDDLFKDLNRYADSAKKADGKVVDLTDCVSMGQAMGRLRAAYGSLAELMGEAELKAMIREARPDLR